MRVKLLALFTIAANCFVIQGMIFFKKSLNFSLLGIFKENFSLLFSPHFTNDQVFRKALKKRKKVQSFEEKLFCTSFNFLRAEKTVNCMFKVNQLKEILKWTEVAGKSH
jgi:hypothetical protein